jgi:hypothetical protein
VRACGPNFQADLNWLVVDLSVGDAAVFEFDFRFSKWKRIATREEKRKKTEGKITKERSGRRRLVSRIDEVAKEREERERPLSKSTVGA